MNGITDDEMERLAREHGLAWVLEPTTNTWLPDIASLVRHRLTHGAPLRLPIDPAVIGRLVLRQLEERRGGRSLRLSSSGDCLRKLAYIHHGVEEDPESVMDAGSMVAFVIGDLTEALLAVALREAVAALPPALGFTLGRTLHEQETVTLSVPLGPEPWDMLRLYGHPDGSGRAPAQNGRRKSVGFVWECKSMSDYAFGKFRREGLERHDHYMYQTQAYQLSKRQAGEDVSFSYVLSFGKGTAAKDAVIIGGEKQTVATLPSEWEKLDALHGVWIPRDSELQAQIAERWRSVVTSKTPDDFPRAIDPKPSKVKGVEGLRLTFPCDWCPYMRRCWGRDNIHEVVVETSRFAMTPPTKIQTFIKEKP